MSKRNKGNVVAQQARRRMRQRILTRLTRAGGPLSEVGDGSPGHPPLFPKKPWVNQFGSGFSYDVPKALPPWCYDKSAYSPFRSRGPGSSRASR